MEPPSIETPIGNRADHPHGGASTGDVSLRLLADVPIQLEAGDRARRAVLASYTAAWELPTDIPTDQPIAFRFVDGSIEPPNRAPDLEGFGQAQWLAGDHLHITDLPGCTALATRTDLTVAGPASLRMLERTAGTALGHVLRLRGLLTMHAAAFLLPEGGAVLVTGRTGAGKSSLAGIALAQGWPVLSDDTTIVDVTGEPRVTGLPRAPALPPEITTGTAPLDVERTDARQRCYLSAGALTSGWHPLVALVRVTHGQQPTSVLTPRPARDSLDDVLFGQMGQTTPRQVQASLQAAATLARMPAFGLAHGSDREHRAESGAARLLELRTRLNGEPPT